MNQINSIILEGVISNKQEEKDFCNVSIKNFRTYKDKQGTPMEKYSEFVVQCRNKTAEVLKHSQVGNVMRVVGRLEEERYKHNGKFLTRVIIVAEHIEMIFGLEVC